MSDSATHLNHKSSKYQQTGFFCYNHWPAFCCLYTRSLILVFPHLPPHSGDMCLFPLTRTVSPAQPDLQCCGALLSKTLPGVILVCCTTHHENRKLIVHRVRIVWIWHDKWPAKTRLFHWSAAAALPSGRKSNQIAFQKVHMKWNQLP